MGKTRHWSAQTGTLKTKKDQNRHLSADTGTWQSVYREVLHGVGADGVGVKFPIFAVNCCLLLSFRRSREKSEEKGEKCVKKGEKCIKKGENHSDPIYTNPIKNLPSLGELWLWIILTETNYWLMFVPQSLIFLMWWNSSQQWQSWHSMFTLFSFSEVIWKESKLERKQTPPPPPLKRRTFMDMGFFPAERAHFSRRP